MHLVQTGIYEVVGVVKQRAVGGQYGHKAFSTRLCHKPGKMRVQSGFAHKVKIEKFYLALQSIGKQVKFVDGHDALCPIGLRAEEAIEVADIGDFEVAARYHNRGIKKVQPGQSFIFCPMRRVEVRDMPFFLQRWSTVVPLRRAMRSRVSPLRTVTVRGRESAAGLVLD